MEDCGERLSTRQEGVVSLANHFFSCCAASRTGPEKIVIVLVVVLIVVFMPNRQEAHLIPN